MENETNDIIQEALTRVIGLQRAHPVYDDDCSQILSLEQEAEERSLMGLGKVVNTGVRTVMEYEHIHVALTTMEFDWSACTPLILKKGDQVVGEEIHDNERIAELKKDRNIWFMHKNFAIYKNRISFPKDIMNKICHFEIPLLSADWLSIETRESGRLTAFYSTPSTLSDVYLKDRYFGRTDEKGLGTILIGFKQKPLTANKRE